MNPCQGVDFHIKQNKYKQCTLKGDYNTELGGYYCPAHTHHPVKTIPTAREEAKQ